ncbi:hypothetical protein ACH5RR_036389 [Cinchona calisaya]|uniref:Uncharacterized protein n=1 Tax=Cinchona calisaya TaxID=153742 RepID=A0ABD2Y7Z7_9GENT
MRRENEKRHAREKRFPDEVGGGRRGADHLMMMKKEGGSRKRWRLKQQRKRSRYVDKGAEIGKMYITFDKYLHRYIRENSPDPNTIKGLQQVVQGLNRYGLDLLLKMLCVNLAKKFQQVKP